MQLGRMIDELRKRGNDKRADHLQNKLDGMLYAMAGKGGQPASAHVHERRRAWNSVRLWDRYQEARRKRAAEMRRAYAASRRAHDASAPRGYGTATARRSRAPGQGARRVRT
jgi:hypothetical protein